MLYNISITCTFQKEGSKQIYGMGLIPNEVQYGLWILEISRIYYWFVTYTQII